MDMQAVVSAIGSLIIYSSLLRKAPRIRANLGAACAKRNSVLDTMNCACTFCAKVLWTEVCVQILGNLVSTQGVAHATWLW